MNILNKHYIRTDAKGYIVKAFSDAFEQPLTTDILIEEGDRHYNLDIWDNGIPKLKYDNGIRPCTQAEIDVYKVGLPKQPPSGNDRITAVENAIAVLMGV